MFKICFVGLGSIGKRHIKNIVQVLRERHYSFFIDAIRSKAGNLPDEIRILIRNIYYSIEEIEEKYDVIFITNPTVLHYGSMRQFMPYTSHMFIEKPVFHEYRESLEDLNLNSSGIYYVACPLRYNSVLQEIKKKIQKEAVYSVRVISSSYLPDWRGEIDFRDTYSAHKNMGGGVTLDLIHELDYVIWLFGSPQESSHFWGKYSDLEMDCDDLSVYLLRYQDKIVEIHTDYFGRETVRNIELYCRDYVIKGDILNNRLIYVYPQKKQEEIYLEGTDFYLQEMEAFVDMIEGRRENENNVAYANQTLKIALDK